MPSTSFFFWQCLTLTLSFHFDILIININIDLITMHCQCKIFLHRDAIIMYADILGNYVMTIFKITHGGN